MGHLSDRYHDAADVLGDHPILRRWVLPVIFMAGLLLPIFATSDATGLESVQLVVVYLAFSAVAVLVGLGVERAIESTFG